MCSNPMAKSSAKISFMIILVWITVLARAQQDTCQSSGSLQGSAGNCNTADGSQCCKATESYPTYDCSPSVTSQTSADLTLNGFGQGESGGGASECDEQYHSNSEMIVALSTGWFDNKSRCGKQIQINANGKTVTATVVDECDSRHGCDQEHAFQPPCANNVVDASSAVWDALGLNQDDGHADITWSDA
ncbi:hypothetical protein SUGI_0875020 [Cryptomeria japonica]|nr:hypothetical protein SUGI_0875020 [Cryptomeria japonica]